MKGLLKKTAFVAVVTGIVVVLLAPETRVKPPRRVIDPEAAALIDQLVFTEELLVGHSRWFPNVPRPEQPPVLDRIIELGIKALPQLLEDIADSRLTKIRFSGMGFSGNEKRPYQQFTGIFRAHWYDPRHAEQEQERDFPGPEEWEFLPDYTVRVGDLCYYAIGQIVNRNLTPFRYQPTLILYINSPLENPNLIKQVRKDWHGLTVEEHQRSLEKDLVTPGRLYGAVHRWFNYYPEQAEKQVVKLLKRSVYDGTKTWKFIRDKLIAEKNVKKLPVLFDEFKAANGNTAADQVLAELARLRITTYAADEEKKDAERILRTLCPGMALHPPLLFQVASLYDQRELIESLEPFNSHKVDQAIQQLYLQLDPACTDGFSQDEMDLFVRACIGRLLGSGLLEEEFARYCQKRVKEIANPTSREIWQDYLDSIEQARQQILKR